MLTYISSQHLSYISAGSHALTIPMGTTHVVLAQDRAVASAASIGGATLTAVSGGNAFHYGDITGRSNDTLSLTGAQAHAVVHYLSANTLGELSNGSESASAGAHSKTSATPSVSGGNAWGCCTGYGGTEATAFSAHDDAQSYQESFNPPNSSNGGAHVTPAGAADATVTVGMTVPSFLIPGTFRWAFFEETVPTVMIAPDVAELEAETPAGVTVLPTGDVDIFVVTAVLEAETDEGIDIDTTGPMQVALEGLDKEHHRTTTGGTEGQVLTYHTSTEPTWEDASAGASALDDLTDVDAPTPGDGEVLTWDAGASEWIAAPGATGSGNVVGVWDDADPGTPAQDESIWYDTDADTPVASAESSGTAFPSSPLTNTRFYRTDVRGGMWFRYDGTRWLSEQQFSLHGYAQHAASADTNRQYLPLPTDYDVYLTRWHNALYVNTSATWVATLETSDFDNAVVSIATKSTASQTGSKMYHYSDSLGITVISTGGNVTAAITSLAIWYDEQSGTATFWGSTVIDYRLIAT